MHGGNMLTEETIRTLEEKLARSSVRNPVQDISELIADEFIEYGSSGRIFDKSQVIEGLQSREPVEIILSDFDVKSLASDVILATYRAEIHQSDERIKHSLRSSIWGFTEERWQIIFHQGTLSTG
ncbi:DUF4440 domain-containing protein [Chloroflexota bacterium]